MPAFLDPGLVLGGDSERPVRPLRLKGEEYIGPPVRSPLWGGLAGLLEAITAGAKRFDKLTTPGDQAPIMGLAGLWRVLGGQAAGEAAARKSEGGSFLAPAGGALNPDSMPLPTKSAIDLGLAAAPLLPGVGKLVGGLAARIPDQRAVMLPLDLLKRERLPLSGSLALPTGERFGAVAHEPVVSLPAVADTGPGYSGQLRDLLPELANSRVGDVRLSMPKSLPAGEAAFSPEEWRMVVSPHDSPLQRLGLLHHEATHAGQALGRTLGQGSDPGFIPHNWHSFRSGLGEVGELAPELRDGLDRTLLHANRDPHAAYTRDLGEVVANTAQRTVLTPEPHDLLLGLASRAAGLDNSTVFLQTPRGNLVLYPTSLLSHPSVRLNGPNLLTREGRPLGTIVPMTGTP